MNEVLDALACVKSEEEKRKILKGIVDNKLSKEECRKIAIELTESCYSLEITTRILLNNGKV